MSLWGKLQKIGFIGNQTFIGAAKLLFRDTGIFINSPADGKLAISADGTGADDITITGSITGVGNQAITGNVAITGSLTASAGVLSGGVVSATDATLALTQALHANKVVTIDRAAGVAFTLPEATGTGDKYKLVLGTAMTSGSTTVTTADTTNADYAGSILMVDLDAATTAYIAQTIQATGDDIFTMNRTTTGGVNVGLDWVEFIDIKADLWAVNGVLYVPTGSNPATPFSGT